MLFLWFVLFLCASWPLWCAQYTPRCRLTWKTLCNWYFVVVAYSSSSATAAAAFLLVIIIIIIFFRFSFLVCKCIFFTVRYNLWSALSHFRISYALKMQTNMLQNQKRWNTAHVLHRTVNRNVNETKTDGCDLFSLIRWLIVKWMQMHLVREDTTACTVIMLSIQKLA